jgi:dimethylhistidine N-methyltransferase
MKGDVLKGLSLTAKRLPSCWLYDNRGSELFEAITHLQAYYPTRTETSILATFAVEIGDFVGADAALIEYGAGAGIKTEILLGALTTPQLYMPIDIAGDFLERTAARLRRRFPNLTVWPLLADFTVAFDIPSAVPDRRVAFFPGSTLGNLDQADCARFLKQVGIHVGSSGRALIGVDLIKDVETLHAAYDDPEGVTGEFNLNLLRRLNRELDANFQLEKFRHQARWNAADLAMEMHIVSIAGQSVRIGDTVFTFEAGESIHTETCRKFDLKTFAEGVCASGWRLSTTWTDPARRFAVCGLEAEPGRR